MPSLRLGHQLGFAIGGLLVLVGALSGWNLLVTRQLTVAHRSLVDSGIPAVRLEVELLEHLAAMRRMEGRYAILNDPAFLGIFRDRMRATAADVGRLEALLHTPVEQNLLREVRTYLDEFWNLPLERFKHAAERSRAGGAR